MAKISAKEVVQDIRSGMDDTGLMQKYGISAQGLRVLFRKLLEMGAVTEAELLNRTPASDKTMSMAWKCPACGKAQPREVPECPDCSVNISEFLEGRTRPKPVAKASPSKTASPPPTPTKANDDGTDPGFPMSLLTRGREFISKLGVKGRIDDLVERFAERYPEAYEKFSRFWETRKRLVMVVSAVTVAVVLFVTMGFFLTSYVLQRDYQALRKAIEKGQPEMVRSLLDRGYDPNAKDKDGFTVLLYASVKGQLDTVRLLVERGADLHAKNKYGGFPLLSAAGEGHVEVVRFLLEKGADVNARTQDGYTALLAASTLEGSRFDPKTNRMEFFPLPGTARERKIAVVKLLLENGADPNCRIGSRGGTVLIDACSRGYVEIVKLLLENGADFNIADDSSMTALMRAADNGHIEVVKLLLVKGADPNARTTTKHLPGSAAIMFASAEGRVEIVDLLLQGGADPNVEDRMGVTPLSLAIRGGHREVVKLLEGQGAKK